MQQKVVSIGQQAREWGLKHTLRLLSGASVAYRVLVSCSRSARHGDQCSFLAHRVERLRTRWVPSNEAHVQKYVQYTVEAAVCFRFKLVE